MSTKEELRVAREANDAFWERKIAEAEAAGGAIEGDLADIPVMPGCAVCLPSARVTGAGKIGFEMPGGASAGFPRDDEGDPWRVVTTGRFRLTVEPPSPRG